MYDYWQTRRQYAYLLEWFRQRNVDSTSTIIIAWVELYQSSRRSRGSRHGESDDTCGEEECRKEPSPKSHRIAEKTPSAWYVREKRENDFTHLCMQAPIRIIRLHAYDRLRNGG